LRRLRAGQPRALPRARVVRVHGVCAARRRRILDRVRRRAGRPAARAHPRALPRAARRRERCVHARSAFRRDRARDERPRMTGGGDRGKMPQTAWRVAMKHLLAMALLLACAGCGEVSTHSKNDVLTNTLNAYANALRWGDFEQALSFVDPETLKAHPLTD